MFETAALVEDCRAALQDDRPSRNVREVLAAALADPGPVIAALGEPKAGGIQTLHRSAELTVLKVLWSPGMVLMPHNHEMWAVIGIYTGREDNILWRRLEGGSRVEAAGARSLGPGHTVVTVICDGAARSQSRLFSRKWLEAKGLLAAVPEDCRHLVSLA